MIPPPRLNSPTRFGRIASIIILALFPAGYYGFLVSVTGSTWSWREFFLVSYFFGLSFEISLLHTAAARNSTIHIEPGCPHIGTVMMSNSKYERLVTQHFLRALTSEPVDD